MNLLRLLSQVLDHLLTPAGSNASSSSDLSWCMLESSTLTFADSMAALVLSRWSSCFAPFVVNSICLTGQRIT